MIVNKPLEQRINVGDRAYHITSSWSQIRKSGFLEPRTTPIDEADFGVDTRISIEKDECGRYVDQSYDQFNKRRYWQGRFIVCGATKSFDEWKKFGLYEKLLSWTGYKSDAPITLVSFPIEERFNVFVRDHAHLSQKRIKELSGKDMWTDWEDEEFQRIKKIQNQLYADSLRELSGYDRSFEVPELWVSYRIPVSQITVEGVIKRPKRNRKRRIENISSLKRDPKFVEEMNAVIKNILEGFK